MIIWPTISGWQDGHQWCSRNHHCRLGIYWHYFAYSDSVFNVAITSQRVSACGKVIISKYSVVKERCKKHWMMCSDVKRFLALSVVQKWERLLNYVYTFWTDCSSILVVFVFLLNMWFELLRINYLLMYLEFSLLKFSLELGRQWS